MDGPLEPDCLRDRPAVPFQTETRSVDRETFETARRLESHVTVGIANDTGEVLFASDDARGWTLPAAPVGANEVWATVADRVTTSLTGGDGALDEPIRVRQVEFEGPGMAEPHTTYDVLVRATVSGRPIGDDPVVAGEDVQELVWLDRVPPEGAAAIAGDVRSILEDR